MVHDARIEGFLGFGGFLIKGFGGLACVRDLVDEMVLTG